MNRHEIFSVSRTMHLLMQYLMENRRRLLLQGLTLLTVMILFALYCGFNYTYINGRVTRTAIPVETGCFVACISIGAFLVASTLFNDLSEKRSALRMLMIPSSWLEVFLVRWIVAVPVYLVWSLICVILADASRVTVLRIIYPAAAKYTDWFDIFIFNNHLPVDMVWFLVLGFLMVQSFFFLGAVVWHKHHFMKTFLSLIVIGIIYLKFSFSFAVNHWGANFRHTDMDSTLWFDICFMIIILANYSLTCLRYSEEDLIHRW